MQTKSIRLKVAAAALFLLAIAPAAEAALSVEQRLSDYGQLVSIVKRSYGPLRWKKESIGLDFAKLTTDFETRVRAVKSDAEFYRTLSAFLSSLKDGHTKGVIPSNYTGSLGFVADLVAGKVLIESVDTLKLPSVIFPFKRGDEVIAIGDRPVAQLIDELSQINHNGNEASTRRIAAARLTVRREAAGFEVPKGITTVTVLPAGAKQPVTVSLTWNNTGSPLVELDDLGAVLEDQANEGSATSGEDSFAEAIAKSSFANLALPKATRDDFARIGLSDMGSPKSVFTLPEGARVLDKLPITAAIYQAAGKRIGVLRIHSYMDDGLLEALKRALIEMEQETDVLVLDQTYNPGGSVSLVSKIVGLFADKSYRDMNFVVRPSLNWMESFRGLSDKADETLAKNSQDVVANVLKGRFEYLEGEVRSAIEQKRFYTAPFSLDLTGAGYGMIQPNASVRYTKPVLLLINELDFSGGDEFPALMKDNGRVTLFGAQTAGAGGNVNEYGPLANSYFKFNLTESLMVRPNGQFVENRGIVPDVAYAITEDDFNNGYRGYVAAFTKEALKLTGMSDAEIAEGTKPAVAGLSIIRR
ncbi:MAG: protease-like activity factor CPAF [Proteobacteria bacterium]|nr:MAG: protease-like activity factor CPAF [Pseudomonadota bacterium]